MARGANDDGDGIVARLKETADGLGQLVADHVRLARVELVADARIYGRGVAVVLVAGTLLFIGYAFAWTAAALALARVWGAPLAFAGVAAVHLVVGVVGVTSAARRMRRTPILHDSGIEAARSVTALMNPVVAERLDPTGLDGTHLEGTRLDGGIAHDYQQSR
jgi:uncharacterized membrane protein YqjE